MKVNGRMTKHQAMVFTITWMEPNMRVIGRTINRMVKVKRHGQMGLSSLGSIEMARRMVMVNSIGRMVAHMMESSSTIR